MRLREESLITSMFGSSQEKSFLVYHYLMPFRAELSNGSVHECFVVESFIGNRLKNTVFLHFIVIFLKHNFQV